MYIHTYIFVHIYIHVYICLYVNICADASIICRNTDHTPKTIQSSYLFTYVHVYLSAFLDTCTRMHLYVSFPCSTAYCTHCKT